MRTRHLVIVAAGDHSLHQSYASDRTYDLWVCYWGDNDEVAGHYAAGCDHLFRLKGQKWDLVRKVAAQAKELGLREFSSYDYVFLPDDDLRFPQGAATIAAALELGHTIGADLFQPAILNDHYSWETTRKIPGMACHATNMVEIMMPAYSGRVFERCVLPLLHIHPHIRAGWGIEPLAARMAEWELNRPPRCFVLDETPAIHTRPVGKGTASHRLGWLEAFLNPLTTAMPVATLRSFPNPADALAFEFPPTGEHLDNHVLQSHMERVANSYDLERLSRKRNLPGHLLRGIAWMFRPTN